MAWNPAPQAGPGRPVAVVDDLASAVRLVRAAHAIRNEYISLGEAREFVNLVAEPFEDGGLALVALRVRTRGALCKGHIGWFGGRHPLCCGHCRR